MAWNTNRTAKQSWNEGQVVNVGFVRDLEVLKRIPTPGDGCPDFYILRHSNTGKVYSFQPHMGLVRHDTIAQAMQH